MEWINFSAPARMTTGPSARTMAGLANNPAPRPAPRPAMNSRRRIPDVIAHSSFKPEKCNKHAARTDAYQRLRRAPGLDHRGVPRLAFRRGSAGMLPGFKRG